MLLVNAYQEKRKRMTKKCGVGLLGGHSDAVSGQYRPLIISNPSPCQSNRAPKGKRFISSHSSDTSSDRKHTRTKDSNVDGGNQCLEGLVVLIVSLGKVHSVHLCLNVVLLLYYD